MADALAIGIDVGGTKVASALVSAKGSVLTSRSMPTDPQNGQSAVIDHIAGEIEDLLFRAKGAAVGIGIGIPGIVIPPEGVVRNAVNLGWEEVYLVNEIRSRLEIDLPIWLQSDKNATALGEYYFGAARGCRDFIYLAIGTGLGAGVISNGQIVVGAAWDAGEIGHLSLDPHGRMCVCGLRGCAETVISGPGLVNLTREELIKGVWTTSLVNSPELNPLEILAAARRGDELALACVHELWRIIGDCNGSHCGNIEP